MAAQTNAIQSEDGKGPFKAWHALLWFAGFFGFMFAVNGIFLWTAITTFPGEDVEKSYLTGLNYNDEIDRRSRQMEAGWVTAIGITGTGEARELTIRLTTREQDVLFASEVVAEIRHPADRTHDRVITLSPALDADYTAPIGDFAPGLWTVVVTADIDPDTEGYELRASKKVHLP